MSAMEHNLTAGTWSDEESTFAAHAARHHVPLAATFELTARCSLKCKMCYVRLDASQQKQIGPELTVSQWISLAQDAAKAGTLNMLITGGEPMLRPDFAEIYTAMCKMGFIITINTNATTMNEEYFRLFSKYPPTAMAVSLYGACPETYEKLCGDASGFEKTIRGLEMIKKLPVSLEIRTTFVKDNMHELEAIREIANRYTNRYAINVMVFKAVRGADADVEGTRLEPARCIDIDYANYLYYREKSIDEQKALEARGIKPDEESPKKEEKEKDYGLHLPPTILTCLAAKACCWISWDGKMLPCGSFTTPYTLPLEEGFTEAWNRLPTLLEGIGHPAECTDCLYINACPNCPANLQAETGGLDSFSPYLCSLAKERNMRYGADF